MSGTVKVSQVKLGDSADPTKNFQINVPAVPDGTLTIERGDGTDVLQVSALGVVTTPGNAQTWQTFNPTDNQSYTNDTPLPVTIAIKLTSAVNTAMTGTITIAGIVISQFAAPPVAAQQSLHTLYAEIPAGAVFSVHWTGAAAMTGNMLRTA